MSKMKWRKIGLVFSPQGNYPWMQTHAALPVTRQLDSHLYRVYFSSRDAENRAHIGFVDFDIRFPQVTQHICREYVLAPGPLGHFDDYGVLMASIVRQGQTYYLYYTGWNRGAREPLWYGNIGVAISEDGETFHKISPAPILSRSEFDPCLVASPCVMIDQGVWRMWYVSGFKWEERGKDGRPQSFYHVKYAESKDGVNWVRNGRVCIDLRDEETNIARPCVLREGNTYKMWYCCDSGGGYRIGYAESRDGYDWDRMDDDAGIAVSSSGWDSQALAYPWVFVHDGSVYMLYNGNRFGKEGFGLAKVDT